MIELFTLSEGSLYYTVVKNSYMTAQEIIDTPKWWYMRSFIEEQFPEMQVWVK